MVAEGGFIARHTGSALKHGLHQEARMEIATFEMEALMGKLLRSSCQEQPPAHGEGSFEIRRGGRDG